MEEEKLLIKVVIFGLCFIFLLVLVFAPMINILDKCENREWDGSELNIGVRSLDIGEDFGEDIIVKCNKAPKETDAMIDVFDALPFIELKEKKK